MAFDAQFLSAALQEVQALADPRVEKIHQPSRDTVIVHLRHGEGRAKLLIAANPAAPRLHLTAANPESVTGTQYQLARLLGVLAQNQIKNPITTRDRTAATIIANILKSPLIIEF